MYQVGRKCAVSQICRGGRLLVVLLGSSVLTPLAFAQQTTGIEEVIVTAEKRQSTVQKTPISITAISGDDLQASGTADVMGVALQTPGISFKTSGPGQTEFEMRGLTASGGSSPTVGFYLDEIPLSPPASSGNGKVVIDPNLYDLSRVEVLRGPQGTLYGSGSMGGTIKLLTNQPDPNKFAANVSVTGQGTQGGGPGEAVSAMVNMPLVDGKVALRIVGTDSFTGGWIDRYTLGDKFPLESNPVQGFYGSTRGNVTATPIQNDTKDVNWERLEGGRASLLVQANDNLSITPMVLYQRISMGGPSIIDNPPGNVDAHYQPLNVAEPFADAFKLAANTVKYDLSNIQFTSATSYWTREEKMVQDSSESIQSIFGTTAFSVANGGVGPVTLSENDRSHQFSQELRVASTSNDPFQWLLGGFYSDFTSENVTYSFVPGFLDLGFPTMNLLNYDETYTIKQKAIFGEASYQILPSLKATVGLRWYSYDSKLALVESGIATTTGGDNVAALNTVASDSGFNPKFNLSYIPSDDLTIYGTVAKGFRPGAANPIVPLSGPVQCLTGPGNLQSIGKTSAPVNYSPDSLWSYELGEKGKMFNGRLVVNGDVYYETWSNVQTLVPLSCGFPYTDNAASAGVYGTELEIKAKLTNDLTVSTSAGYTRATYSEDSPEARIHRGEPLFDVPNWTGSVSLSYLHPINDDYTFTARLSDEYMGPRQDITYSINNLPAYNLVSLRLGILVEQWDASFFGNNLTNKRAQISNWNSVSENLPSFNRVAINQPRTFGVTANYHF